MSEHEQVKPLAPAAWHIRSDEELSTESRLRQRKYVICCGCTTAVLLILAVILIVLGFTVLHVREPIIHMNRIIIQRLELDDNGIPRTDVNITLLAEVSVKNPNYASFRFKNTTTLIYYGGAEVGEGRNPPGKAKARRTMRMNMTVDVIPAEVAAVPGFSSEYSSGRALTFDTYTKVDGKVKIASVVKKNVEVKLNCTVSFNIKSGEIQNKPCIQKVSL